MVFPSRRNLGIGLSLHDHVMKFLKTGVDPTLQQVQLSSIFHVSFPDYLLIFLDVNKHGSVIGDGNYPLLVKEAVQTCLLI